MTVEDKTKHSDRIKSFLQKRKEAESKAPAGEKAKAARTKKVQFFYTIISLLLKRLCLCRQLPIALKTDRINNERSFKI